MQLADEIPMSWFSLLGASSCLRRLHGVDIRAMVGVYSAVLCTGILMTEQHSTFHEFFRGVTVLSFSMSIVVVAWGSTVLVSRPKLLCRRSSVGKESVFLELAK